MVSIPVDWDPVLLAFLGTLFTWFLTALGAATCLLPFEPSRKVLDTALGFAAGVMIAASYWSLLAPAIAFAEGGTLPAYAPPAIGFLLGGAAMFLLDRVLPHLHLGGEREEAEGPDTAWRRTTLLALAVTLHNIPEGLAVGVSFGSAGADPARIAGAAALAFGIGIQNLPEGMAISVPFRSLGMGRLKAVWYGQLSGVVEVVGGVLGALLVTVIEPSLPYALAFAAGAMIYVVVEDVIPESHRHGYEDAATVAALIGFALMMTLDVALG